jgi:hypothetical protein
MSRLGAGQIKEDRPESDPIEQRCYEIDFYGEPIDVFRLKRKVRRAMHGGLWKSSGWNYCCFCVENPTGAPAVCCLVANPTGAPAVACLVAMPAGPPAVCCFWACEP